MVKFPYVSRKLCDTQQAMIDLQKRVIEDLRAQNAELKALFNKTSQFEVVEQKDSAVTLRLKPQTVPTNTRGGWRAQREAAEQSMRPVTADSVQALEKRVAEAKES